MHALDHLKDSKRHHFYIKPDNVLEFEGGYFVLSDFGTALLIDLNKLSNNSIKGYIPKFASPELLNLANNPNSL